MRAISPVVSPFAYSDKTISSTPPSRRCRFLTICGSNVPSRSRGTSIPTWPVPLGDHRLRPGARSGRSPARRPGSARFFSWPRCSVSSWSRAVSITILVSCFSSPSGPVSSRPRARASPPSLPRRPAPATAAALPACPSCHFGVDSQHPMSSLTVPIPPDLGPACRAGNTARCTVPSRNLVDGEAVEPRSWSSWAAAVSAAARTSRCVKRTASGTGTSPSPAYDPRCALKVDALVAQRVALVDADDRGRETRYVVEGGERRPGQRVPVVEGLDAVADRAAVVVQVEPDAVVLGGGRVLRGRPLGALCRCLIGDLHLGSTLCGCVAVPVRWLIARPAAVTGLVRAVRTVRSARCQPVG